MQIEKSALVFVLALAAVAVGCDDVGPRVYTARAYDSEQACLYYYAPIGVVEADELGALCAETCLRDGEGQLYVSSVCAPYPPSVEKEEPEESAECARALAAVESESFCDAEPMEPDPDAGGAEATDGPEQ